MVSYLDSKDRVLTVEELAQAISNRTGIPVEDAMDDAHYIMDIFGYEDRIIDNVLEPQDRQTFYQLEDEELLTTEREETTLYDGREWRTHYWLLKKYRVFKMAEEEREVRRRRRAQAESADVYAKLKDDIWTNRQL